MAFDIHTINKNCTLQEAALSRDEGDETQTRKHEAFRRAMTTTDQGKNERKRCRAGKSLSEEVRLVLGLG